MIVCHCAGRTPSQVQSLSPPLQVPGPPPSASDDASTILFDGIFYTPTRRALEKLTASIDFFIPLTIFNYSIVPFYVTLPIRSIGGGPELKYIDCMVFCSGILRRFMARPPGRDTSGMGIFLFIYMG